jgi:hypothetical protein
MRLCDPKSGRRDAVTLYGVRQSGPPSAHGRLVSPIRMGGFRVLLMRPANPGLVTRSAKFRAGPVMTAAADQLPRVGGWRRCITFSSRLRCINGMWLIRIKTLGANGLLPVVD